VSADLLLSELQALNIRLWVEGDRLRCSAPKGSLTDELGQRIAAHKSELIHALSTSGFKTFPIPWRSPGDTMVPLSFAQERFWFLQNLEPDTTAYNITAYRHVSTPLDTNALQFALRALIDKHEMLRTTFPGVDGVPIQLVHQASYPELTVRDFGPLQGEARTAALHSVVEEFATLKFDLLHGPLLRIALVRFSDHDQCVVVCLHHILCDAWSIGIFFAELGSLYTARISGEATSGPSLPIQYADFAIWERGRDASGELQAQVDYWKEKLQGAPSYLELPTDHPRPAFQVHERKRHSFQLDASTSQSLKSLAGQESATLFMALLAVFKALLFRYTKQTDIVVGTPVSTRNYSELEQLIGCFLNTHVLRTTFASSVTARDLLARVRATVLESLHHPDVPFERLVGELLTERDMSRAPLFQVAFILQNTPASSEYEVISGGNDFDITLYMWEANGLIGGNVEYNSTLFEPETIAGLARCYETLAGEMVADPDAAIDRLPVVTAAQEAEWFGHYNGPAVPIPALRTHEWIEQQTSATPDAMAVVAGEVRLTYKQLSEASNRLAHQLREMGVTRGRLVALCLDRTADLVIAPLAVWKAGGAYLPLDPEFPSERLAFMLEDSAAQVLVTQNHLLRRLPSTVPATICVDGDLASLEYDGTKAPATSASADDLAYLLYTSGSTGKPKGVEIGHRALANFLSSMQREPGMTPSDRLLAVTTFSFDIAGLELYLPLVSGAQVVIAPRATVVDGAALTEMLSDSGITVMQATPATWRLLFESGWKETPGLKILCGGEALTASLAKQLIAAGAEAWNLYGPTETTIWSTLERLSPATDQISIGRPIANTQIHLLDDNGHPAPVGVAAELCIGGDGLARGYLRREQLTAQRFVYSAFHGGKRLYRTGDIARRLPDGGLEYKGRIDDQVKLRGFRIEPGEIEAALEKQSGISQAVVVVREDIPGDPQLIAYVRIADSAVLDSRVLRKQLLRFLPEYMIPSSFVQLEAFPLTANGKVNRKALRSPEYGPRQLSDASQKEDQPDTGVHGETSAAGYIAPSNNIELTMAEIWRDVLGVDRVGVLDNFFELGGHSLTAVRLVSRLKTAFDMDLPLRCLFLHPTIAELSRHISYSASTHSYRYTSELPKWSCLVPVQPRGKRTPLFMVAGYSDPDATLLALAQLAPHLGMNQPLFGLRPRWLEGNDNYASVEEMAREFVAEIRAAQPRGPYMLGGWCVGGIAALEIAQLLQAQGQEVKLMVLLDTERPSFSRTLRTKLLSTRERISHIASVLSEIAHAGPQRSTMVRHLVHKKLNGDDPFYRSMIAYQRQLYSHTPKRYPGRITLILNQEEIRYRQKDLGWTGIPLLGLDVHVVPGDHYTIMKDYAKDVAQVILRSIEAPGAGHVSRKLERTGMQAVETSYLSS
jgi:amino acid adenylation domain-containing protein